MSTASAISPPPPARTSMRKWVSWLLPLFCIVAFGSISVLWGPDQNWDLRNYHYYNVYAWLNGRLDYDLAPAFMQSYLNPLLDVPFYLLAKTQSARLGGFVFGALHGLNIWLLAIVGRILLFPKGGRWQWVLLPVCAICAMLMPAFLLELGTTYNDNLVSLLTLSSLILLLSRLTTNPDQLESWRWLIAGLLAGASVGLKLTSAVFAAPLLIMTLWFGPTLRKRMVGFFGFGFSAFVAMVACMGPWCFLLWQHFDSPLFPFYNHIFKSDMTLHHSFEDPRWLTYEGLGGFLLFPFRWTLNTRLISERLPSSPIFFVLYSVFLAALVACLLRWILKRWRPARTASRSIPVAAFFTFYGLSFILWQKAFAYYRYLFILELLAPILLVLLLITIVRYRSVGYLVGVLACVGVLAWARPQVRTEPATWPESVLRIMPPELPDPERTLVLLPDHRTPLAYVIPSFHPGTRFVRIIGLLSEPGMDVGMQHRAREIIEQHEGPIYALYALPIDEPIPGMLTLLDDRLSHFQLECADGKPLIVRSHLGSLKMQEVRRADPLPPSIDLPIQEETTFLFVDRRVVDRLGEVRLRDEPIKWQDAGGWSMVALPQPEEGLDQPARLTFSANPTLPKSAFKPWLVNGQETIWFLPHDKKRNHTSHGVFYESVAVEPPYQWSADPMDMPIPLREDDDRFTVLRIGVRLIRDPELAVPTTRTNRRWMLDDGDGSQQQPIIHGDYLYFVLNVPNRVGRYVSINNRTLYPPAGRLGRATTVQALTAHRRVFLQPDPSWTHVTVSGNLIVTDQTLAKRSCQIVVNGVPQPERKLALETYHRRNHLSLDVPVDGSLDCITIEVKDAGILDLQIEPGIEANPPDAS